MDGAGPPPPAGGTEFLTRCCDDSALLFRISKFCTLFSSACLPETFIFVMLPTWEKSTFYRSWEGNRGIVGWTERTTPPGQVSAPKLFFFFFFPLLENCSGRMLGAVSTDNSEPQRQLVRQNLSLCAGVGTTRCPSGFACGAAPRRCLRCAVCPEG